MLIENLEAPIQNIYKGRPVWLDVLRLDLIDPVISGNKIFKLLPYLEQAKQENKTGIVTYGGAYSNHLIATAAACNRLGLKCIGLVRGFRPTKLSHTLKDCTNLGMTFEFIAPKEYKEIANGKNKYCKLNYPDFFEVPEGGYGQQGALGASKIMEQKDFSSYTHICLAVGTGTTCAGLILNKMAHQKIISIPVLKSLDDINERIEFLTKGIKQAELVVWPEYHFGGYAKYNRVLLEFIDKCKMQNSLPLDFVYTAKAFYGLIEKINDGFFTHDNKVLFIHTGGLQGNASII